MVVVQWAVFDDSGSRVVVPLVRAAEVRVASGRFNPAFVVMGDAVVLHPLETTTVAIQSFASRSPRWPARATTSWPRWTSC